MEITFYFSNDEIRKLEKNFKYPIQYFQRHVHKLGSEAIIRNEVRGGQMNKRIIEITDDMIRENLINRAWNEGITVNKLVLKEIIYPVLSTIEL